MPQTTTPFIVQKVLRLELRNLEDSAGGFPGNLDGANVQLIVENTDSGSRSIRVGMPQVRSDLDSAYMNGNYKLSGQGQSELPIMIGGGWLDSGSVLYDSAMNKNTLLLDSDQIVAKLTAKGISTKQDLDASSLTTFSTSTHTPLHRMTLNGHSSGTVADTSSRTWNRSLSTATIGGKTAVNSNVSYNFGYLDGSNVNWPQNFTLFAIYYNKSNADDYWYNHYSSYHLVKIGNTNTTGEGEISLGGSSTYTATGAKVTKDTWQRIIITGSASSTTQGASTNYKVYVDGVETGSCTATGIVGYALKSGTSYNFAYSSYTTGYFLELGVISSVLNGSQLAELDGHLQHRLNGSTAAFDNEFFGDSDKVQFTYSGDSTNHFTPMHNSNRAGSPPAFKAVDNSTSLLKLYINNADTVRRNTVPALLKRIIIGDSASSTFIDNTPHEFTSDVGGDSARIKGNREHNFQRITTLDFHNDPRLDIVPDDSEAGGGGIGPVQAWF